MINQYKLMGFLDKMSEYGDTEPLSELWGSMCIKHGVPDNIAVNPDWYEVMPVIEALNIMIKNGAFNHPAIPPLTTTKTEQ